jgi:hypothetical protein
MVWLYMARNDRHLLKQSCSPSRCDASVLVQKPDPSSMDDIQANITLRAPSKAPPVLMLSGVRRSLAQEMMRSRAEGCLSVCPVESSGLMR